MRDPVYILILTLGAVRIAKVLQLSERPEGSEHGRLELVLWRLSAYATELMHEANSCH